MTGETDLELVAQTLRTLITRLDVMCPLCGSLDGHRDHCQLNRIARIDGASAAVR